MDSSRRVASTYPSYRRRPASTAEMDPGLRRDDKNRVKCPVPTTKSKLISGDPGMLLGVNPLIAVGVLASTAATDAAYVFFNAAVSGRRRFWAANWSAIWYLLSAFAVISYTENAIYVLFAAPGGRRIAARRHGL